MVGGSKFRRAVATKAAQHAEEYSRDTIGAASFRRYHRMLPIFCGGDVMRKSTLSIVILAIAVSSSMLTTHPALSTCQAGEPPAANAPAAPDQSAPPIAA